MQPDRQAWILLRGGDRKGKRRVSRPNIPAASARPVAAPEAAPLPEDAQPIAVRPEPARPARPAPGAAGRRSPASPASPTTRARVNLLSTDFSAVRNDLRRIAMIGGGIFVVLVILTFVIR